MSNRLSKSQPFWEAVEDRRRSRKGRPPKFKTAAELAQACQEYFDWCEENPFWEAKAFSFQGESWIEKVPRMRVPTLTGLQAFIGVNDQTWREWRTEKTVKHLSGIVSYIDQIIYDQKFTGAAAGVLNPTVIIRDLGLKDQSAVDNRMQNPDGTPLEFPGTIVLKGKRADDDGSS